MPPLNQSSEHHHILAYGSVVTFGRDKVTIDFKDNNDTPLKLKISFLENLEKGKAVITQIAQDGSYLDVFIYNANGPAGTTEPLQVATDTVTNKNTLLALHFQPFGNSFVINYTIFEEK